MKRLLSLDILRGITVCGMILVNNAGGPVSYAPLRHSVWNGLTPCDLVFPFFLFMVGISTYISLRKFNFEPTHEVVKKIFRRMFLIILIGLGIEWFGYACDGNFLYNFMCRFEIKFPERYVSGNTDHKQKERENQVTRSESVPYRMAQRCVRNGPSGIVYQNHAAYRDAA
jgi:hypothetical protein